MRSGEDVGRPHPIRVGDICKAVVAATGAQTVQAPRGLGDQAWGAAGAAGAASPPAACC